MTGVRSPIVRVIARDPKRLQQRFELQKYFHLCRYFCCYNASLNPIVLSRNHS
jgi:hypothetical protein